VKQNRSIIAMKKDEQPYQEKRRYKRIKKNFVVTYFDLAAPKQKHEISQLKNISLGGMCFITTQQYTPGTKLGMELKTPYISGTTYLEGKVLESHEKVKKMIYDTRLQFDTLSHDAQFLLKELIEYFLNGEGKSYE